MIIREFKSIVRFLLPSLRRYKIKFILLLSCILFTIATSSFYPYLFGRLVDTLFYIGDRNKLYHIIFIYTWLFLSNQVGHLFLNKLWAELSIDYLFLIRENLFSKFLHTSYSFVSSIEKGDFISRLDNDVDQVIELIHNNLFYTLANILSLILSIIFICSINIYIGVVTIILVPTQGMIVSYFGKRLNKLNRQLLEENANVIQWLIMLTDRFKTIRYYNCLSLVQNEYLKKQEYQNKVEFEIQFDESMSGITADLVSTVTKIIIIVIAFFQMKDSLITLGGFIAILEYYNRGVDMFSRLNNRGNQFHKNIAALKRVITLDKFLVEENKQGKLSFGINEIELRSLTYKYKEQTIFEGLNASLKKGRIHFIYGDIGAGKSMLVDIFCRYCIETSGSFFVNGKNIKELSVRDYRNRMGVLHQDSYLFNGSIRYNIDPKNRFTDARVWNILNKVNLKNDFVLLKFNLDTIVGDDAVSLSKGQIQRILLARLMLRDLDMVILDEAFSGLDSLNRKSMMNIIRTVFKDKLVIMITHQKEFYESGDIIIEI